MCITGLAVSTTMMLATLPVIVRLPGICTASTFRPKTRVLLVETIAPAPIAVA